jgi:serine protease Do
MKDRALFVLLAAVSVLPARAAAEPAAKVYAAPAEALNLQEAFARAAAGVKPAVAAIAAGSGQLSDGAPLERDPEEMFGRYFFPAAPHRAGKAETYTGRRVPNTGSGVVVGAAGYILTSAHVVNGAEVITVTFAGDPGKSYSGSVVGLDKGADLALIKIEGKKGLVCARLGDSSKLRAGDWAIAVGSPAGLAQAVTVGVISAPSQKLPAGQGTYVDVIQTDAAINPGNSGGPLLNIRGEVIGINTASYSAKGEFAGIGFAIPVNRAKELLSGLNMQR